MSYQLKKVRLLSYKLHAAFTPSAHFRPKKAPRAIFSRGGGRVYFGVNGRFLCLGGPSYGHWKTMRVVLKNFFDLTPLSPYPNIVGVVIYSIAIYFISVDIVGVAIYSLVARTIASLGCTDQRPGGDLIINKDAPNYTLHIIHVTL